MRDAGRQIAPLLAFYDLVFDGIVVRVGVRDRRRRRSRRRRPRPRTIVVVGAQALGHGLSRVDHRDPGRRGHLFADAVRSRAQARACPPDRRSPPPARASSALRDPKRSCPGGADGGKLERPSHHRRSSETGPKAPHHCATRYNAMVSRSTTIGSIPSMLQGASRVVSSGALGSAARRTRVSVALVLLQGVEVDHHVVDVVAVDRALGLELDHLADLILADERNVHQSAAPPRGMGTPCSGCRARSCHPP